MQAGLARGPEDGFQGLVCIGLHGLLVGRHRSQPLIDAGLGYVDEPRVPEPGEDVVLDVLAKPVLGSCLQRSPFECAILQPLGEVLSQIDPL